MSGRAKGPTYFDTGTGNDFWRHACKRLFAEEPWDWSKGAPSGPHKKLLESGKVFALAAETALKTGRDFKRQPLVEFFVADECDAYGRDLQMLSTSDREEADARNNRSVTEALKALAEFELILDLGRAAYQLRAKGLALYNELKLAHLLARPQSARDVSDAAMSRAGADEHSWAGLALRLPEFEDAGVEALPLPSLLKRQPPPRHLKHRFLRVETHLTLPPLGLGAFQIHGISISSAAILPIGP